MQKVTSCGIELTKSSVAGTKPEERCNPPVEPLRGARIFVAWELRSPFDGLVRVATLASGLLLSRWRSNVVAWQSKGGFNRRDVREKLVDLIGEERPHEEMGDGARQQL